MAAAEIVYEAKTEVKLTVPLKQKDNLRLTLNKCTVTVHNTIIGNICSPNFAGVKELLTLHSNEKQPETCNTENIDRIRSNNPDAYSSLQSQRVEIVTKGYTIQIAKPKCCASKDNRQPFMNEIKEMGEKSVNQNIGIIETLVFGHNLSDELTHPKTTSGGNDSEPKEYTSTESNVMVRTSTSETGKLQMRAKLIKKTTVHNPSINGGKCRNPLEIHGPQSVKVLKFPITRVSHPNISSHLIDHNLKPLQIQHNYANKPKHIIKLNDVRMGYERPKVLNNVLHSNSWCPSMCERNTHSSKMTLTHVQSAKDVIQSISEVGSDAVYMDIASDTSSTFNPQTPIGDPPLDTDDMKEILIPNSALTSNLLGVDHYLPDISDLSEFQNIQMDTEESCIEPQQLTPSISHDMLNRDWDPLYGNWHCKPSICTTTFTSIQMLLGSSEISPNIQANVMHSCCTVSVNSYSCMTPSPFTSSVHHERTMVIDSSTFFPSAYAGVTESVYMDTLCSMASPKATSIPMLSLNLLPILDNNTSFLPICDMDRAHLFDKPMTSADTSTGMMSPLTQLIEQESREPSPPISVAVLTDLICDISSAYQYPASKSLTFTPDCMKSMSSLHIPVPMLCEESFKLESSPQQQLNRNGLVPQTIFHGVGQSIQFGDADSFGSSSNFLSPPPSVEKMASQRSTPCLDNESGYFTVDEHDLQPLSPVIQCWHQPLLQGYDDGGGAMEADAGPAMLSGYCAGPVSHSAAMLSGYCVGPMSHSAAMLSGCCSGPTSHSAAMLSAYCSGPTSHNAAMLSGYCAGPSSSSLPYSHHDTQYLSSLLQPTPTDDPFVEQDDIGRAICCPFSDLIQLHPGFPESERITPNPYLWTDDYQTDGVDTFQMFTSHTPTPRQDPGRLCIPDNERGEGGRGYIKAEASGVYGRRIQSDQITTSSTPQQLKVHAGLETQKRRYRRRAVTASVGKKRSVSDGPGGGDEDRSSARHNEPLNQTAVNLMQVWYQEHLKNPYPTKDEKEQMALAGGISSMQVKSWFANKRNRSNNTRPKVQKRAMEEKLLQIYNKLSMTDGGEGRQNSSDIIMKELSQIIESKIEPKEFTIEMHAPKICHS